MLLGCYIPDCEFRQNPLLLGLIPLQKGGCPAPWGRFGLTPASSPPSTPVSALLCASHTGADPPAEFTAQLPHASPHFFPTPNNIRDTEPPRVRFKLHYQHIQLFHLCPLQEAHLSLPPEAVLPPRQWPCRSQPPRAVPRPHPGTQPGKQGQPQPHSPSPPGPSEPEWEIFTLAEPAKLQGSSRITTITQIN